MRRLLNCIVLLITIPGILVACAGAVIAVLGLALVVPPVLLYDGFLRQVGYKLDKSGQVVKNLEVMDGLWNE